MKTYVTEATLARHELRVQAQIDSLLKIWGDEQGLRLLRISCARISDAIREREDPAPARKGFFPRVIQGGVA